MASTYLNKTFGTPTSTQKCTHSFWFKLGSDFTEINFSGMWDNYYSFDIVLDSSSRFRVYSDNTTPTKAIEYVTNRVLRDPSAWYHAVVSIDTTQSGGNRVKIYINGVQETSFATTFEPNQNDSVNIVLGTHSAETSIGRTPAGGGGNYFDGSITHYHYVDGTAYDASAFGETDATTGIWKIKTSPSVTYGTNGFFILKDGNSVTDQSVNSNNWTVGGGTLTNTEDNPSNVFATLNPLVNIGTNTTYSQGNNTVSTNNANYKVSPSTLAVSSGKWYMEFKAVSGSFGSIDAAVGILQTDTNFSTGSQNLNAYPNGYSYGSLGKVRQYNASDVYTASTYADGDIIGIALDMDNNKLYFHKNGTYQNSGDPTSGSTGTGAVSITSGKEYYFACSTITSSGTKVFSANFGNGYFGTTAVASAGTNASGIGIFEYDVPTGYTALSTKGLDL